MKDWCQRLHVSALKLQHCLKTHRHVQRAFTATFLPAYRLLCVEYVPSGNKNILLITLINTFSSERNSLLKPTASLTSTYPRKCVVIGRLVNVSSRGRGFTLFPIKCGLVLERGPPSLVRTIG